MVLQDDEADARDAITDAGIGNELEQPA